MLHSRKIPASRGPVLGALLALVAWSCSPAPVPATPAPGSPSEQPTAVAPPPSGAGGTSGGVAPPSNGPTLPFSLQLKELKGKQLPALHSYSSGRDGNRTLVLGGRVAGLHGFANSTNNFPRSTANVNAFVIDPAAGEVRGSVDLTEALPRELAGPLTATNQEFAQVGTDLYVTGGYGQDLATGKMTTFGSLIKIDVHGLVGAIEKKESIKSYFKAHPSADNRLKVTGGGLRYHAGVFYLAFGQDFTGDYSVENRDYNRAGGQFQKYTEKIRVFTLNPDLSIAQFNQVDAGYDSSLPYHRRDLNLVDIIQSDGVTPGAVVYGGVFKAGQVAGHTTPIDILFASSVTGVRAQLSQFQQALSQYDCAQVTVFDAASQSSLTTLFGGISQYHYDAATASLVLDQVDLAHGVDGLPFIDSISTIIHGPQGSYQQFIQPITLPALLGADAQFIPSAALASAGQVYENGVIKLSALTGTTLVGHLYGGIESFVPYSGLAKQDPSTVASARIFEVYVSPGSSPVLPMPPLPTQATPYPPPAPNPG